MSIFSNIKNFVGGLFDDDEEKKKRQQQQQAAAQKSLQQRQVDLYRRMPNGGSVDEKEFADQKYGADYQWQEGKKIAQEQDRIAAEQKKAAADKAARDKAAADLAVKNAKPAITPPPMPGAPLQKAGVTINTVQKPQNRTISVAAPGTVVKPGMPDVLQKATQNQPQQPKQMSNAEIGARSAGAVATNFTGGLIGAVKGLAQLPAGILETPKLVKMGAAKVTGNKKAMDNAKAESTTLTRAADRWNGWVKPVTDPLTKAELATDDAAANLAPWSTGAGKTLSKVSANLVPVDAAVNGISKLSKVNQASKAAKTAEMVDTLAPNKAPGLTSVNPTRETDAAAQGAAEAANLPPAPEMDPLQQAAQQTIADGKAMDAASARKYALDNSPAGSLRKVNPQGAAGPVEGQIPVRQPAPLDAPVMPENPNVPSYMTRDSRQAAQDAADNAELEAQRQLAINDPINETPAFLRRLNTPEKINDHLRNASSELARDPDFGPVIQEAYLQTGSKNPLSLAAHALASTPDKGRVREMVSRLVPGADGNALNRAVNSIVGAEDQADVLDALHTAIHRTNEQAIEPAPFGPISDAPAVTPENPGIVSTRPDGKHVMSDGTVVDPATGEAAPLHVDTPEPTPDVAPAADNATPNVPSFDEAPTLSKSAKANASPAKAEPVNTSAPAKAEGAGDTNVPTKAVKETAPAKTPQKDLPPAKLSKAAESGETGKSQGKYSKGQEYEKTSMDATRKRGSDAAANTDAESFVKKIEDADGMNGADRDTAVQLQSRHKPGSEMHRKLGDLINKYHTEAAQTLGTIERVIRKTADANHITDRFVNRLYKATDENIKFTDTDFDTVIKKNEDFVKARDDQNAALEAFNKDPSEANAKAVADAYNHADEADRAARFEEYKTAARVTKGSKNPTARAYVKDLEKKAGVYTMDMVDSSMLSSSRVMINNFINTLTVRAEEAMFGKAGAAIARKLTGTTIGGGSRAGAKIGRQMGQRHWAADVKLRKNAEGNKLTKAIKNFTTSGNTLGDRNTYAAAYSSVFDHYRAKLAKEGYKGEELDRRAMVHTLSDPDDIAYTYMNQALAANGMASISTGPAKAKLETEIVDRMTNAAGGGAVAHTASKMFVRMTLGFPTVIVRSAAQGLKRAGVGFPSVGAALINVARKGPKEVTAMHLKNAVKEAGSGAAMYGVGYALGSEGIITGSYPADKAERDRWKREGITEHSVKIGSDYYSLPSALGAFALPFMIGANAANQQSSGNPITKDFWKTNMNTILDSLPVDNISNALSIVNDMKQGKDVGSKLAQMGASATRALTPLGSLVNEVAKMFDPNANDTTQGNALAQFVHKIQDGIPGWSNDLPDKKVDGKPVKNPSPVAKFFGATSTSQTEGIQKTEQIKAEDTKQTDALKETGVFTPKLRGVLDDETKQIFDKASKGEQITDAERKKLNTGLTKNVEVSKDTRYLEDGDYDTNLAVLKAKKAIMEQDPTTQKADLEKYDDQIKRGEVYKTLKTPYDDIKNYHNTELTEWKAMGDPESADYNPDMYEKLFDLDAALTDAGVSGKSSDKTKPKYYVKAAGSGSGGSSRKSAAQKAEDANLKRIQSNTLGSITDLKKVDMSDLRPQKIQTAAIPKIQQIRSSDLIKKRKITVGKA